MAKIVSINPCCALVDMATMVIKRLRPQSRPKATDVFTGEFRFLRVHQEVAHGSGAASALMKTVVHKLLFLVLLLHCAALHPAHGLDNGVGLLPAMGWGTWNLFGCWGIDWTEKDIREMADAMVSSGMKQAGCELSPAPCAHPVSPLQMST